MSGAEAELTGAWGDGGEVTTGWAPGRCTLVGEHVDYAGGAVLAIAVDLGVEVAVRPRSGGDEFRISSAGRRVARATTQPAGDIGDRILAAVEALRRRGLAVPLLDIGVSATLPESAGLSSSAAVVCATLVAVLRLCGARLGAAALAATALSAERDIVGIPCGPLDQTVVVHAPRGGAVLFDCAGGAVTAVPWPWHDVALAACATGEAHDIGGAGYRQRRAECTALMDALGVSVASDIDPDAAASLPEPLNRRARHLLTETRRTGEAAQALRAGDRVAVGRLMDASHESLRDDYAVTTPLLDQVVTTVRAVPGCLGARMVGGGFGGSVVALAEAGAAAECGRVMAAAAGRDPGTGTWVFHPAAGVAELAPDVIDAG